MIDIPDFVYPKDAGGNALCPRCKKVVAQCDCPSHEPAKPKAAPVRPSIRLDKSGRNGKVVTVITLSPNEVTGPFEAYLKDLAKKLKMKTGSGGTFYISECHGVVEIQGDHKDVVTGFFNERKSR